MSNLKLETVFIGVVPGSRTLAGKPFRTDIGGSYCKELRSAKYQCEINGGRSKPFFVEERFIIGNKIGNIKTIHHFNQDAVIKTNSHE